MKKAASKPLISVSIIHLAIHPLASLTALPKASRLTLAVHGIKLVSSLV